ncbi:hypothetical protein [Streptomyces sp. NPDC088727]|uniref:hypothetical protein n=1 Tax=Streptomyces sp. NPDC088727 TaxID=3365875 RepID=UPI0037F33CB4
MPKNHARANAVRDLREELLPARVKRSELLKLLADKRCLELCAVIEFFQGEVNTHADALHALDHNPRFKTLCETCGWSLDMICPECPEGCGCSTGCTGWRHGGFSQDSDADEDEFGEPDDEDDWEPESLFTPPVKENLSPPEFVEPVEEEENSFVADVRTATVTVEEDEGWYLTVEGSDIHTRLWGNEDVEYGNFPAASMGHRLIEHGFMPDRSAANPDLYPDLAHKLAALTLGGWQPRDGMRWTILCTPC